MLDPDFISVMLCVFAWTRTTVNTLRPRQNGRHFPDDIFKCIFFSENVWVSLKISLRFVPNGQINNIPALVQIMAWHRPGDEPLSEPMVVGLLTHICVTRPQWVKYVWSKRSPARMRYGCFGVKMLNKMLALYMLCCAKIGFILPGVNPLFFRVQFLIFMLPGHRNGIIKPVINTFAAVKYVWYWSHWLELSSV